MDVSQSLTTRALMAVLLMVGFYAFALAISVGLIWIPYAEYVYAGRLHFKLAAVCLGAAGAILWSLIPRIDRFKAPGPRLLPANAPGLFALVSEIASGTSQQEPAEIYLLNDVNAWVSQRGGVMGLGSRRIMGVGLPLLNCLSPRELQAVIAHEFGHYCAGDVALGPWIYKTRAAIGRTLFGVRETHLEAIFNWYARMFLRVTMAVSRRQEFVADETAARIAGPDATASALKKVAALSPAYSSYFTGEVVPVLRSGFSPPIAEGFERFLANSPASQELEGTTGEHYGEFDTHPPLAQRVAALKDLPTPAVVQIPDAESPLLLEADEQGRALLAAAMGQAAAEQLQTIPWNAVAESVYAPMWQRLSRNHKDWFRNMTIEQIPAGKTPYIQMGSELLGHQEVRNSDEQIRRAVQVMTAGIGATLIRAGWRPETDPGRPVTLAHGDYRLDPSRIVISLIEDPASYKEWMAACEAMGITGLLLREI